MSVVRTRTGVTEGFLDHAHLCLETAHGLMLHTCLKTINESVQQIHTALINQASRSDFRIDLDDDLEFAEYQKLWDESEKGYFSLMSVEKLNY